MEMVCWLCMVMFAGLLVVSAGYEGTGVVGCGCSEC